MHTKEEESFLRTETSVVYKYNYKLDYALTELWPDQFCAVEANHVNKKMISKRIKAFKMKFMLIIGGYTN
jgi:hypothetical protein